MAVYVTGEIQIPVALERLFLVPSAELPSSIQSDTYRVIKLILPKERQA